MKRTGGEIDLLAAPRMVDIAPTAGHAPTRFIDPGDAVEQTAFEPGIIQRIVERTGVKELRDLVPPADQLEGFGCDGQVEHYAADCAWWDGETHPSSLARAIILPPAAAVHWTPGQPIAGQRSR